MKMKCSYEVELDVQESAQILNLVAAHLPHGHEVHVEVSAQTQEAQRAAGEAVQQSLRMAEEALHMSREEGDTLKEILYLLRRTAAEKEGK